MLLAFSSIMDFKLYQMDVRSVFFNDYTKKEMFVDQPPTFINSNFPDQLLKLKKDLYSLKRS